MTCKHAANATRDANFTSWNRSRWVIRLELQTVRTVRLSAWLWGEDEGNNFAVFLFLVDENYKSALGNGPQRRLKLWTCPTSALFTLRLLPLPPDEEGAQSLTFGQWWWCYRPITQRHITRNASPANRWSPWVSLAASRRLLRCVLVFIVVEAPTVDLIGWRQTDGSSNQVSHVFLWNRWGKLCC